MLIGPLENQTQALELLGSWFISIALTPEIFTVKHRAREMIGCFSKSTSELKTFKGALCHWNSICYAISHLILKKNQLHFWTVRKGVLRDLVTQRWVSHSFCPSRAQERKEGCIIDAVTEEWALYYETWNGIFLDWSGWVEKTLSRKRTPQAETES